MVVSWSREDRGYSREAIHGLSWQEGDLERNWHLSLPKNLREVGSLGLSNRWWSQLGFIQAICGFMPWVSPPDVS